MLRARIVGLSRLVGARRIGAVPLFNADEITAVLDAKDGPPRPTGSTQAKALMLIVARAGSRDQWVLPISQDAAVDLVAKLTPLLKARGLG
jgi:hypothetical protein